MVIHPRNGAPDPSFLFILRPPVYIIYTRQRIGGGGVTICTEIPIFLMYAPGGGGFLKERLAFILIHCYLCHKLLNVEFVTISHSDCQYFGSHFLYQLLISEFLSGSPTPPSLFSDIYLNYRLNDRLDPQEPSHADVLR